MLYMGEFKYNFTNNLVCPPSKYAVRLHQKGVYEGEGRYPFQTSIGGINTAGSFDLQRLEFQEKANRIRSLRAAEERSRLFSSDKFYPIALSSRSVVPSLAHLSAPYTDEGRELADDTRRENRLRKAELSKFFAPTLSSRSVVHQWRPGWQYDTKFDRGRIFAETARRENRFAAMDEAMRNKPKYYPLATVEPPTVEAEYSVADDKAEKSIDRKAGGRAKRKKEFVDGVFSGTYKAFSKAFKNVGKAAFRVTQKGVAAGATAVIGNEIKQASFAQSLVNASEATGAKPIDIAKLAFALKPFGGGVAQARAFSNKLNKFVEEDLFDSSSEFNKAALNYGVALIGSGEGGRATRTELMSNLSDWFKAEKDAGTDRNRERISNMARTIGLDDSMLRLMELGSEKMFERIEESAYGLEESTIEKMDELKQRYGEMGAKLQVAAMNLATFSGVTEKSIDVLTKSLIDPLLDYSKSIREIGGLSNVVYSNEEDLPWWIRFFGSDASKAERLGLTAENYEKYKYFRGDSDAYAKRFIPAGLGVSGSGAWVESINRDTYEQQRSDFLQQLRQSQINIKVSGEVKGADVNFEATHSFGQSSISEGRY